MTKRGKMLTIDRVFRDVGRVKLSSGTSVLRTFRRINEMLTELHERGRSDLIHAIKDRTLSPMRVYEAYSAHDLERLPTADDLLDLRETMAMWAVRYDCSKRHRESLMQSVRYLAPIGETVTVAEIPKRLTALRKRFADSGEARSFNLTRSAAQSFVRATRKKHSRLWQDVSAVEPLSVTPKRDKHPMTPAKFVELWHSLPGDVRSDAWVLAHTGMRRNEYWGQWVPLADRVHVEGTKTRQSVRDIPRVLIVTTAAPQTTYRRFRTTLAEVTGGVVEPYDLRRTFANWLEAAGIPRTRRRMYLGHGAADVTDLYEAHHVSAYLDADARALRNYLVSAIVGLSPNRPEGTPIMESVPPFATPYNNAPPRDRTENLLIKRQVTGVLEIRKDAPR